MKFRVLSEGDPVPWVAFPTPSTTLARIDLSAGRYIVLCILGEATSRVALETLAALHKRRHLFDDVRACFFGVTFDPADAARLKDSLPGIRFGLDATGEAGRQLGALSPEEPEGTRPRTVRHMWFVIDPMLRILKVEPVGDAPSVSANAVLDFLEQLPPPSRHSGLVVPAPVLVLPNVFEPAFCRRLVEVFNAGQQAPSGFMDEEDGRTILRHDTAFKSRADVTIDDPDLRTEALKRIQRRVLPEIRKAFQFDVTRMERYLVARYAAGEAGKFGAHRDNTTKGTAHRRFAVSVLLSEDYGGGELAFPEYGAAPLRVPTGCAVVFSCTLMHEVRPVTRGERFVFVPFLYDEAAAALRVANNEFLGEGIGTYDPDPVGREN